MVIAHLLLMVWGVVLLPGVSVEILGPCVVLATILRCKEFALYLSDSVIAWSEAKDVMDAICDLDGTVGKLAWADAKMPGQDLGWRVLLWGSF